ncbi:permease-like cell division protein FtsX [Nonomuraea sp. LPB2021202275-12-8]|uniref:permease-like cell division protein FtsX n=1 Tax=Nonomuraea sp. LPB2021202275-12-8 TaxID=3120159 RepID=UPI003FA5BB86
MPGHWVLCQMWRQAGASDLSAAEPHGPSIEGPGRTSALTVGAGRENQAEAYANFKKAHADKQALINATRVEDMPESFRIMLVPDASDADRAGVRAALERMPGVSRVVDQRCRTTPILLFAHFGIPTEESKVCSG